MKEIVKSLCKDKGMNLKDLAERMGITRESLTRSISGNTTLSTITAIAKALDVPVWRLFTDTQGNEPNGFIEYKGTIHRIQSRSDLERVLSLIPND